MMIEWTYRRKRIAAYGFVTLVVLAACTSLTSILSPHKKSMGTVLQLFSAGKEREREIRTVNFEATN